MSLPVQLIWTRADMDLPYVRGIKLWGIWEGLVFDGERVCIERVPPQ